MTKRFAILLLAICLALGAIGCVVTTAGEGSWELYGGFRTKQYGKEPAKITIKSNVVDKIVDSFTDGEVTEDE